MRSFMAKGLWVNFPSHFDVVDGEFLKYHVLQTKREWAPSCVGAVRFYVPSTGLNHPCMIHADWTGMTTISCRAYNDGCDTSPSSISGGCWSSKIVCSPFVSLWGEETIFGGTAVVTCTSSSLSGFISIACSRVVARWWLENDSVILQCTKVKTVYRKRVLQKTCWECLQGDSNFQVLRNTIVRFLPYHILTNKVQQHWFQYAFQESTDSALCTQGRVLECEVWCFVND